MHAVQRRILVVEDDEEFRNLLELALQTSFPAAKIKTADDGVQACAYLGSFLPDLIMMDIDMAEMNGISPARFIIKDERYRNTRMMVLTGLKEDDPKVMALRDMNVTNIFFKPTGIEDMLKQAESLLTWSS